MIPLFKPQVPRPERWLPFYEESLKSGMLTNFGPNHRAVTTALDSWSLGFHLPVSNGTVALEVALRVQCRPLSRVAIPDFTFAATANAVIRAGMQPVIYPCKYETGQIDIDALEGHNGHFDAILFVAPFGYAIQEKARLVALARKLEVPLIFDLAGAWPMDVDGHTCCYSLHAAKSLPIGEGGMIKFSHAIDRDKARRLIAFDFDENKSAVTSQGMNGKLDDLHCAILRAQLLKKNYLMRRIALRSSLIHDYQFVLAGLCDPVYDLGYPSLCVLRGLPAQEIVDEGVRQGIVFRRYYHPLLTDQEGFRHSFATVGKSDERLNSYLAFPSDVTQDEFEQVCACVMSVVEKPSKKK